MNGHKSSSIFCFFLAFFVLMAAGCSPFYTLKGYGTLPPTVKEAMVVKLSGSELEMVNSGIYVNEGEPYSIVAAGFVILRWIETTSLNERVSLVIRIGQEPYFNPLSGTFYSLNGTTRIAPANGNLYLALDFHTIDKMLYRVEGGEVDVLIIVWETDDKAQIVGSLQKLREDAKKSNAPTNFINGFDDAIDQAKGLRQDISE